MMAPATESLSVLVGPTCDSCASDDLHWGTPLGGVLPVECGGCGSEYHWYEAPPSRSSASHDVTTEATCPLCGRSYDAGDDAPFCDDCQLSDCAYCGITTNRPFLSDDLACRVCSEGEVA